MPHYYDDSDEDLYENPYAESDTDADDDDVDEVYENPAKELWPITKIADREYAFDTDADFDAAMHKIGWVSASARPDLFHVGDTVLHSSQNGYERWCTITKVFKNGSFRVAYPEGKNSNLYPGFAFKQLPVQNPDDDDEVYENPASVVRTARDERLWRMAKASAAKQGRARDWPYVMGIFQHMKQRTGSEPVENPRELRSNGFFDLFRSKKPAPQAGPARVYTPEERDEAIAARSTSDVVNNTPLVLTRAEDRVIELDGVPTPARHVFTQEEDLRYQSAEQREETTVEYRGRLYVVSSYRKNTAYAGSGVGGRWSEWHHQFFALLPDGRRQKLDVFGINRIVHDTAVQMLPQVVKNNESLVENPDDEDAPPPRPMTMEEARAARLARSLAFEIPPEPDYAAISAQVERERLEYEQQRAAERAKRQAAPPPPALQLRASAVQQGLFATSSYEAKPQKKKPAAPVDTRQRDLFGLPIDDEPRENPEPRILRFESRAEANRWMREHDVLGRAHESYPDGWIIVFSQKGRVFAVASPEEGVYEGVWLQDW